MKLLQKIFSKKYWKENEYLDNIGPDVTEYINYIKNMKVEEIKEHLKNLSIEELHDIKSIIRDTIENKKVGNIPIGETFKFFGKEYIVKSFEQNIVNPCVYCAFCDKACNYLCCSGSDRHDKQHVIFVEKENNN